VLSFPREKIFLRQKYAPEGEFGREVPNQGMLMHEQKKSVTMKEKKLNKL
jgi:hypothetical protein